MSSSSHAGFNLWREIRLRAHQSLLSRIVRIDGLFLIPLSAAVILVGVLLLLDRGENALLDGATLSLGSPQALISIAGGMVPAIIGILASWGYGGVFSLMLAESISLPLPSEVILPYAGYLVFTGRLDFWVTVFLSTTAGTAGALVDYYIGLKLSQNRTLRSMRRINYIDEKLVRVIDRWFSRHASSAVFLSRMIPGARTLVSFPAGATRMPVLKFIAYTTSGCLIWSATLIYVGVYLGRNWEAFLSVSGLLSAITLGAVASILVGWLLFKRARQKIERTKEQTEGLSG